MVDLGEFLRTRLDAEDCALWLENSEELRRSRALADVRWGASIAAGESPPDACASVIVDQLRLPGVVSLGDVITISTTHRLVSVLWRRASRSNSLLVTERCNSYCVMCSQPPIERNESGRLAQLLATIPLIDPSEEQLGITGGEPTLLGRGLTELLATCDAYLPRTRLHVLTNGRAFKDEGFARDVSLAANNVMWAVPLYADAPEVHDFVVQRVGAFEETLAGLMSLARLGQRVELRVVIQKAVLPRIGKLAHFIGRNLPFVDHVAWMGLEPMGFARANWAAIAVDPSQYSRVLHDALFSLEVLGVQSSIYNIPLCVLPKELHRYAAQSISDWKNKFLPECASCALRPQCCGFFASAGPEHTPRGVAALHASPS